MAFEEINAYFEQFNIYRVAEDILSPETLVWLRFLQRLIPPFASKETEVTELKNQVGLTAVRHHRVVTKTHCVSIILTLIFEQKAKVIIMQHIKVCLLCNWCGPCRRIAPALILIVDSVMNPKLMSFREHFKNACQRILNTYMAADTVSLVFNANEWMPLLMGRCPPPIPTDTVVTVTTVWMWE